MKIIKRSGEEVDFNKSNIYNAISKANQQVDISRRLTDDQINEIVASVVDQVKKETHTVNVEDVQDFVEKELMKSKKFDVMHGYITYRYEQANKRQKNTTDDKILSLLSNKNEEVNQENANKNPMIASTQRDYMAGEVSKDLTRRFLLPADIWKAHEEGLIHFHDADYFASPIHNCDLVNLEDMLQNGTVISGTKIDKPHKFSTACNIATQIIAQVASSQYGGQTISLAHLSPFVEESRDKFYKDEIKDRSGEELTEPGNEGNETLDDGSMTVAEVYAKHGSKDIYKLNLKYDDNYIVSIEKEKNTDVYKMTTMQVDYESTMFAVEKETANDIRDGVQTIQYQIITLMTTNGQAPFVSICMYLNEAKTATAKKDLALVIEEVLKQRILGVKNQKGIYVAPSFPKLLYVLEEDNVNEDSKFYYLTKLAAECTSKRMVPDYISEKKMLEYKIDKNGNGHAYPCMGCVDGQELITYKYNSELKTDNFENVWDKFSKIFKICHQYDDTNNPNLYINVKNFEIFDTKKGFVRCDTLIRNISEKWTKISYNFENLIHDIDCTVDHEFLNESGSLIAKNIKVKDTFIINNSDDCNKISYINANVVDVKFYNMKKFSYDVVTSSHSFEVSGVYSHNCRSFLTPYVHDVTYSEDDPCIVVTDDVGELC